MCKNVSDSTGYVLDPHGLSTMNVVEAYYFLDKHNPEYLVDPTDISKLNHVVMNSAHLDYSYNEGNPCTTKTLGTTAIGELMSCVNGRWTKPGGSDGGAFWYAENTSNPSNKCYLGKCQPNPRTGAYSCPAGYTAIGGLVGQAYNYSQWDQTTYYFSCVKA